MAAREKDMEPGETMLGGSGVVFFRGLRRPRKPRIILPSRPTKSSWCSKYMSWIGGYYQRSQ